MSEALSSFSQNLLQEVATEASIEGREVTLHESFTETTIDLLTEQGAWQGGQVCFHKSRGIEVSGWGWDDEDQTLDLAVSAFVATGIVERLGKSEGEALVNRLRNFFIQSVNNLHEKIEESSPQFDLAWFIHENCKKISRVRLSVFSNQITNLKSDAASEPIEGISCQLDIWDLERLERLSSSGQGREPIAVDFVARYGTGLQCLEAPNEDPELQSFLVVIPGAILADLYNEYGARLLELNVRSFLQATGGINRGIRNTLNNEPARFFSYNNGISATASNVVIAGSEYSYRLNHISDLQIVNGGQTTASIANAVRKDKADMSQVSVQAKLTVVPEDKIAEIVPNISKFANSQNRISSSDLSANHPYHVDMEKLSRSIWAPSPEGGLRETRWFYERARGQYNDELYREGTPARRKAFKEAHPPSQKFSKTDLAKFELTWAQKPHIVSRGAQKSFAMFMVELAKANQVPDQIVFEQMCAKAILFRTAEKIVQRQKFGGYRANIVAYTLAWIYHHTTMRLDLAAIWSRQAIGPLMEEAIESVCIEVHRFIVDPPGGGNVTEYTKRETCWESFLNQEISCVDLGAECKSLRDRARTPGRDPQRQDSLEESQEVSWAKSIPGPHWFAISSWAKDTDQLQSWQRGIAFSLGKLESTGREPSIKQARHGKKLYEEAVKLGWKYE